MACKGCTGCKVTDKVKEIAKKYKGEDGGVMNALHEIQDEYGYISEENQKYLSTELNIPLSEIYGIITFYSRFSLVPKAKYNIQVCLGTACYVKGAGKVYDKFRNQLGIKGQGISSKDGLFSVEEVRCIGACSLAPAITINGEVHGFVKEEEVDKYIENCKKQEEMN